MNERCLANGLPSPSSTSVALLLRSSEGVSIPLSHSSPSFASTEGGGGLFVDAQPDEAARAHPSSSDEEDASRACCDWVFIFCGWVLIEQEPKEKSLPQSFRSGGGSAVSIHGQKPCEKRLVLEPS